MQYPLKQHRQSDYTKTGHKGDPDLVGLKEVLNHIQLSLLREIWFVLCVCGVNPAIYFYAV